MKVGGKFPVARMTRQRPAERSADAAAPTKVATGRPKLLFGAFDDTFCTSAACRAVRSASRSSARNAPELRTSATASAVQTCRSLAPFVTCLTSTVSSLQHLTGTSAISTVYITPAIALRHLRPHAERGPTGRFLHEQVQLIYTSQRQGILNTPSLLHRQCLDSKGIVTCNVIV